MPTFLFLMNSDTTRPERVEDWGSFVQGLIATKRLLGGSSLGNGVAVRKNDEAMERATSHVGYLLIEAADLDDARALLEGNPVFEAGGTVEIHELVPDRSRV